MTLQMHPVSKKAVPIILGILLLANAFVSAQVKEVDPKHAEKMTQGLALFKKEVRTVLIGRCLKCHGGKKTESEFDLSTREGLLKGGENGAAIKVGEPDKSLLVKLITHAEEPLMPEDGAKLDQRSIDNIVKWIELGAPYDVPLTTANEQENWVNRRIDDSLRQFWSFQPLRKPVPPTDTADQWSKTDIDRFVLAKLKSNGLEPSKPVDRRRFIRRAYFDVIGLPPTPEQIDQFVNDQDPDAVSKMLDQLLDSPHYGERWGRHWLDIARFGESHGFEQDYDRPHAYHYRDFVIRALNSDMPYDQFVRWQIAGDEIEPDNPLAQMATGFLGAGVFPTQLTEKEFESARYDELDDMVATLGTSMLGVTIGCARCHDHKFDPIPQADYYRMISTFRTTIRNIVDLDLAEGNKAEATKQWEAEQAKLQAALDAFEKDELPQRFDAWLKSGPKPESFQGKWIVLDLDKFESAGGATMTKLADGSILATGKNPDFDKYTFSTVVHQQGIKAIRLEALADDSLVRKGPGRAGNGNFGLGNISVTAQPISGNAEPITIKLVEPRATFEQNQGNLSIAASLDDQKNTGWAVDPKFGENHAAIFQFSEPFGSAEGTRLTFTLEFNVNNLHNFGRTRISLTTEEKTPEFFGPAVEQGLAELFAELGKSKDGTGQHKIDAKRRGELVKLYRPIDPRWQELKAALDANLSKKPQPQLTKVQISSEGLKPIPHHGDDRGFPHFYPESYFLNRGDVTQKQGVAEQGFLQILMRLDADKTSGDSTQTAERGESPDDSISLWRETAPENWRTSYRRRSLSNWIIDVDHGAGHLLARVIVNRLWQHHFGRGIVATPNDFGFQGARPTHPELLDWLAIRLIEENWRLKTIHKLIMSSAVYAQDSELDAARVKLDPKNELLWRFEPRRLEAEIIRDSMLAVSQQLDEQMFGPGTLDENMRRRSIYFMIKRSKLIPAMQVFDAPEPLASVGDRPSTTIAPQALMFMNSPQARAYAVGFAKRIAEKAKVSLDEAIQQGYLIAVGRGPNGDELNANRQFLEQQIASYQADKRADATQLALADFCQVLMCLNEFVYID